jgi:hypothetical protein
MIDETDIRRAESAHAAALADVKKALPGKPGFGIEEAWDRAFRVGGDLVWANTLETSVVNTRELLVMAVARGC